MKENQNKSDSSKKSKRSLKSLLKDFRGEYRKIIWPSKKDLTSKTVTVIVTSIIVGIVIMGFDAFFAYGLAFFTQIFGN